MSAAPARERLRVGPSDRHFETADGQPFFWLGDTAWELFHRLTDDEIETYLLDRALKGFTVIQAVLLAELGGLAEPDPRGHLALLDQNPSTPNPAYFAVVDRVLDRAADLGLYLALAPTWGSYVTGGWGGDPVIFDVDNAHRYGAWLGQRYGDRPNVAWLNGGDTNPIWRPPGAGDGPLGDYTDVFDALARGLVDGVAAVSSGEPPVILYHPTAVSLPGSPPAIAHAYYGNREWLTADAVQSGHARSNRAHGWDSTRNYELVQRMWEAQPARPVLDLENHYEDFWIDFDKANRMWDADDIRNGAYQAVFGGAAGCVYGNWNVWQMHEPRRGEGRFASADWRSALRSPGSGQLHHLKDLVLSRHFTDQRPAPELLVGDPGEGEEHLAVLADRYGRHLLAYTPFGQPISVRTSSLADPPSRAAWFDPRTGKFLDVAVPNADGPVIRAAPPSSGRGNDWVLVLE